MKNVGTSLQKMLEKASRKMLTKKCWNIYKMLTKNVGYTLKNVEKMMTSLKQC
jgi:ABC-type uncharacterized transport system YnjBCD substrate-binding protein